MKLNVDKTCYILSLKIKGMLLRHAVKRRETEVEFQPCIIYREKIASSEKGMGIHSIA